MPGPAGFPQAAFEPTAFDTPISHGVAPSIPTVVSKIEPLVYPGIHGFMGRAGATGRRRIYVSSAPPARKPFTR